MSAAQNLRPTQLVPPLSLEIVHRPQLANQQSDSSHPKLGKYLPPNVNAYQLQVVQDIENSGSAKTRGTPVRPGPLDPLLSHGQKDILNTKICVQEG